MTDSFDDNRKERQELGYLYRHTKDKFGDKVDIIYLDPRNLLMIYFYFMKHVKKGNIKLGIAILHLLMHLKRGAIFINGVYVKDNVEKTIDLYL